MHCSFVMQCPQKTKQQILLHRMQRAGPFDYCCSHQSVVSPFFLLVSGLAVVIMSTFCDGFMVQYVNAGQISAFVILLFDCFVCHQNVTCLKRFTR